MENYDLPKGFTWIDLQPAIKPACEKLVRSEIFKNLVEIVRQDPNLRKIEFDIEIKDIDYHPGLYHAVIGKTSVDCQLAIHYREQGFKITSTGEIDK